MQPVKELLSAAGRCAGRGCALIRQLANSSILVAGPLLYFAISNAVVYAGDLAHVRASEVFFSGVYFPSFVYTCSISDFCLLPCPISKAHFVI